MRFSFILDILFMRGGVIGACSSLLLVFVFIARAEYGLATLCVAGCAICIVFMRDRVERERRELRQMFERLRCLESLSFDEACAKVAQDSVPVPNELARMREFPSPSPAGRHRYFERDEVVFRVEETSEGRVRFVPQKLKHNA